MNRNKGKKKTKTGSVKQNVTCKDKTYKIKHEAIMTVKVLTDIRVLQ